MFINNDCEAGGPMEKGHVTGAKPLTSVTNNAVASEKITNMSGVFLIQMEFLHVSTAVEGC